MELHNNNGENWDSKKWIEKFHIKAFYSFSFAKVNLNIY